MRRIAWVLMTAVLMAGSSPLLDDVTKVLPDAEKVKKARVKLDKDELAKVEKALGEKVKISKMKIYEARATVPMLGMEKTKVYVVILNVVGPKGKLKIGVAAVPQERILAKVAILENKDDKAAEAEGFLLQFEDFEYSESLFEPASQLADARKKAKGSDKDAKTLALLLDLNVEMRKVQGLWDSITDKIDKKNKSASRDTADLRKLSAEIEKMTDKIPFYKSSQQKRYNKYMSDMTRGLRTLKGEIDGGKWDDAYKEAVEVYKAYCSRCHASSQRAFERERESLHIGNGYFDPLLDVYNPNEKQDKLIRAILKQVRKAVLVLAAWKG